VKFFRGIFGRIFGGCRPQPPKEPAPPLLDQCEVRAFVVARIEIMDLKQERSLIRYELDQARAALAASGRELESCAATMADQARIIDELRELFAMGAPAPVEVAEVAFNDNAADE
jgi:hypothetical protein